MTGNEKTRFTIRNRLADHFDEGFADDLMSLVPPFDVSELATRAEMALGFAGVDAEFGSLRAEMALGFARVDTKFAELRSEMHQNLRNSNMAMMSLMVALHGLLFAALKIWP